METDEEIAPLKKTEEPPKKKKNTIRGYPNDLLLQGLADAAAETINPATGKTFRRGGLQIFNKKEHGFPGQKEINSDGIWKYLIFCHRERASVQKIKEGLNVLQGRR